MRPALIALIVYGQLVAVALSYDVFVMDRSIGYNEGPVISFSLNTSAYPYSFNPAWLPLPGNPGGGLFVRVNSDPDHSDLVFLESTAKPGEPPSFQYADESRIFRRHNTSEYNRYSIDDPRAVYRPATGVSYVTYQNIGVHGRQTWISQTSTPLNMSSWVENPEMMFPGWTDCGTCLFFPDDTDGAPGAKAYAIATFGGLRGGNLTLMSSTDPLLQNWTEEGMLLETRQGKWDDRTLSSAATPVRLSDGSWLLLYDVDNKWPVEKPLPIPWYGRCALGWAILDGNDPTKVLARAEWPLLYAQLPMDMEGYTPRAVYTESIVPEGNDSFILYYGAADTVVGAVRIKVSLD